MRLRPVIKQTILNALALEETHLEDGKSRHLAVRDDVSHIDRSLAQVHEAQEYIKAQPVSYDED